MSEKVVSLLRQLTAQQHPVCTGVVTAVDLAELTCDVTPDDGGAELVGVRLRAVVDGAADGFAVIPKVGSTVTLLLLDADTALLVQASTLQLLSIRTANESLKELLKDTYAAIRRMVFTTNNGPTVKLVNELEFEALENRLDLLLHD